MSLIVNLEQISRLDLGFLFLTWVNFRVLVNVRRDITSRKFGLEKISYTSILTCEQGEIYFMLMH